MASEQDFADVLRTIDEIAAQQPTRLSFQDISTRAYRLVVKGSGDRLYDEVKTKFTAFVSGVRQTVMKEPDMMFLECLLKEWKKFTDATNKVRDILMYLDGQIRGRRGGQKDKKQIFELGVSLFGDQVFHQACLERILRLVLSIVRQERNGEIVGSQSRNQLREVCHMMLQISREAVYQEHFEKRFLDESRQYFHAEAVVFFANNSLPTYLDKVLGRLHEERERSKRCFDSDTLKKVEDVVKAEMINAFKEQMINKEGSGCAVMLKSWKLQELKKAYQVLTLVEGALVPLMRMVEEYCVGEGTAVMDEGEGPKKKKPTVMVQEMIELHEKYDTLQDTSFSRLTAGKPIRDVEFAKSIARAFRTVVNSNSDFCEYLARYVHDKLRKGKHTIDESQFEKLFDQVIAIFRHFTHKDVFEHWYRHFLAKRLLESLSQSQEAEETFVSKLKTVFGYQFTRHIEGMFKDMNTNQDLGRIFKQHVSETGAKKKLGYDLTVKVLTTGSWPIELEQQYTVTLPKNVSDGMGIFGDFYKVRHEGKKLVWRLNKGSCDVLANGYPRNYVMIVSTQQYIIMQLYNALEEPKLSLREMVAQTGIPALEVRTALASLATKRPGVYMPVLKITEGKGFKADTIFGPNPAYQSKGLKVKIQEAVITRSRAQLHVKKKIEEERQWQMDAAIVRIMKMRKTRMHTELVMEVVDQLKDHFKPRPTQVKRRIEALIEKEYMRRSPDDRKQYHYIA